MVCYARGQWNSIIDYDLQFFLLMLSFTSIYNIYKHPYITVAWPNKLIIIKLNLCSYPTSVIVNAEYNTTLAIACYSIKLTQPHAMHQLMSIMWLVEAKQYCNIWSLFAFLRQWYASSDLDCTFFLNERLSNLFFLLCIKIWWLAQAPVRRQDII